jgi:23S rRNA (cytosine1962-C5)-methyltransferase
MTAPGLEGLLQKAVTRREPLWEEGRTTAVRLVNDAADGLAGVTVDRFAQVAVVSLYRTFEPAEEERLVEAVARLPGVASVYLKRRPREARVVATTQKESLAPEAPAAGPAVDSLVAHENGLAFDIRPGQGLSVGLYLDMRETRAWVRREAKGRTLLNLFSYTCGFGVAALAGGAMRAVNVDASRRVLDWGEANVRLNGGTPERRDFLSGDAFDWLSRFGKKGETFDVVVMDPPSFATTRTSRFSAARDYPKLAEAGARVVAPKGLLVACCNLAQLPESRFEEQVLAGVASAGRRARLLERLGPSPVDFPAEGGVVPGLKVRVLALE